ncbi:hypothetical protein DBP12_03545 [Streptomyces sp. CS014]|nr:hypothetical protein DBP12_03545 [Streptomyces sp. CS014]
MRPGTGVYRNVAPPSGVYRWPSAACCTAAAIATVQYRPGTARAASRRAMMAAVSRSTSSSAVSLRGEGGVGLAAGADRGGSHATGAVRTCGVCVVHGPVSR